MHLVNGQPADSLPLTDRGLHYGDGLFETMCWQDGAVQFWQDHYSRLQKGCQRLNIPCPDKMLLEADLVELATRADISGRRIIKLIVTRGSGGRGYRSPVPADPTRIVSLHAFPDYPEAYYTQGIRLRLCDTRLAQNLGLAGIKHLNRLEQVLARNEWRDDEYAEGIMLNQDGKVIEGTMTNIFWVRNQILFTPSIDQCGIAGVMRGRILQATEVLKINISIGEYDLNDCLDSEGIFLSNSVIGIWPVKEFKEQRWTPHPVIHQLNEVLSS